MKAKKIVLPIFLAIVIALSSFMMFACAKETSSVATFRLFEQTMSAMEADTDTFSTATTETKWNYSRFNGFATKYRLKDVSWKKEVLNSDKEIEVEDVYYDQYVVLISAGLNFIDKYYPMLETLDKRADFGSIDDSVKAMKKSYENMKAEHDKYVDASKIEANVPIMNGFFFNYKLKIIDFLNKVYTCADRLAGFFNNKVKLAAGLGSEEQKAEEVEFYLDLRYFDIVRDFKEVYMASCNAVVIGDIYEYDINETFADFMTMVVSKDKKTDISVEETKTLMTFFNKLKGSSTDARQAANNFSLYKFAFNYDRNLDAYEKDNENARIFYKKLDSYFMGELCTIEKTIVYLTGMVVA